MGEGGGNTSIRAGQVLISEERAIFSKILTFPSSPAPWTRYLSYRYSHSGVHDPSVGGDGVRKMGEGVRELFLGGCWGGSCRRG